MVPGSYTEEDLRFLYDLRTSPDVMEWFPSKTLFSYDSHVKFISDLVIDPMRVQWMIYGEGSRVGFFRADRRLTQDAPAFIENSFETSAVIAADYRGFGVNQTMQRLLLPLAFKEWRRMDWNVKSIRLDNVASIRSVERLGARLLYKKSVTEGVWALSRAEVERWARE